MQVFVRRSSAENAAKVKANSSATSNPSSATSATTRLRARRRPKTRPIPRSRSIVTNRDDRQLELAGGTVDDHRVAFSLVEQRFTDRGVHRNAARLAVDLVRADDLIRLFFAVFVLDLYS